MVVISRPFIQIDLNEFKLHLHLNSRTQFTLHFNSPSRRFYLSVIALVVNEMKKLGEIKSIPLQESFDLLARLNETIGGAAGSSEKENLLHRIYTKWKDTLPNLEEAPLFKVLGRKKEEGDGAIGKTYSFTDAEKDGWANLFDYLGSHENVRLKFALDKIGVGLNEASIIFGEFRNGEAWDQFISSLKKEEKEKAEPGEEKTVPEPIPVPFSAPQKRKFTWLAKNRWLALLATMGILAGAVAIWKGFLILAPIQVASVDRMKHPLPDKPSIAVLPFVNLNKEPDQEYFVDGLTDDLITDLSKISDLLVIARNSTFSYKGKPVKVKEVAEELCVRYVLEGSVRRDGERIRINAQLIDALTGHHLWAERYDGKRGEIFSLQDQINRKIVSALAVKLTAGEKEQVGQRGTDNIAAYEALLEGWDHYYRYTSDGFAKAAAFFKKAVELDPNYGHAYASLATLHMQAANYHAFLPALNISWPEARLRAGEYTRMAMQKPTPAAYTASSARYLIRRQHKGAISELERGLALDPNSPSCLSGMGWALICAGRPKEGIEYINKGIRINPRDRFGYLNLRSRAHFSMGEIAEASNLLEQALRLIPEERGGVMALLAACYSSLGRDQDARATIEIRKRNQMSGPNVAESLFQVPLGDPAVVGRFVEGLIKAGLPPGKIAGGYFPAFKENQLTGKEVKRLLLDSKITGIGRDGHQWWLDRKKNGESTWREGNPISSDTGISRVEGDMICTKFQNRLWGLEYCATVFRNPRGTYESKDEHFLCTDIGFIPFSLVK